MRNVFVGVLVAAALAVAVIFVIGKLPKSDIQLTSVSEEQRNLSENTRREIFAEKASNVRTLHCSKHPCATTVYVADARGL